MPRARLVFVLVVAAALLGACGNDDGGATTTETTPAASAGNGGGAGDVERYCALTEEGDRVGREAFRDVQKDTNATEKDYERAERKFVEENEQLLDDLQEAAPDEIREDVALLVDSTRARAGLGGEVDEAKAQAAETRTNRFEQQNCEK
jgi:hypothetical protein